MTGEQTMWVVCTALAMSGLVCTVATIVNRGKSERQKRLRLIEKALDHPQLDLVTRQELMRVLAAEGQDARQAGAEAWGRVRVLGRTLIVGAGWISFVAAGAALLLVESRVIRSSPPAETLWVPFIGGFILMSLPIAVRELANRAAAPADGR